MLIQASQYLVLLGNSTHPLYPLRRPLHMLPKRRYRHSSRSGSNHHLRERKREIVSVGWAIFGLGGGRRLPKLVTHFRSEFDAESKRKYEGVILIAAWGSTKQTHRAHTRGRVTEIDIPKSVGKENPIGRRIFAFLRYKGREEGITGER